MKISSGTLKGRTVGSSRLFGRKSGKSDLRPTSAKVREALFDILRPILAGTAFLDLYAGTGAVGLQAASCGAGRVVFVEPVRQRAAAIQALVERTCISASVHCETAEQFLKRCASIGSLFDIVFLDPPYDSDQLERILPLLSKYGILTEQGIIVCEHPSRGELPEETDGFLRNRQYRYGDTMLTIYRKRK